MLDRETLVDEHAAIEAVAADLLVGAAQRPPDLVLLGQHRWRLSRLLLAHLAKEDRLLHPQLQRSDNAETVALSRRFEAEMGGLADAFKTFMATWDATAIADDPAGFEADARQVLTALADRIRREEMQLYRHIPPGPASHEVDAGPRRA